MSASIVPFQQAARAVAALPAILKLSPRARAFVVAFVADPTSLSRACKSAGYSYRAYRRLVTVPVVQDAIREQVALRVAECTGKAELISRAIQVIEKVGCKEDPASDMAKVRGLEFIAETQGLRSPKPTTTSESRSVSAVYVNQAPSLAEANKTIAQLNAAKTSE